jgi:uncharacterized sulfatase
MEDYNFEPKDVWDESRHDAHWRNRADDQPFFAVFNLETTHQSRIFGSDSLYEARFAQYLNKIERTDPKKVDLPPYFFDSPEIRKLWARYYDNVNIVDLQIKEILDQLEEDGLTDQTIVFFFSDHGTGMPRGKRALYDSGLEVPLIIWAPEKYQEHYNLKPSTSNDRLVSFVDFAPTILSMLEIEIPQFMQGKPFLGDNSNDERTYVWATADRVDEAYEIVRSVRTKEFRYVRNFLPHMPLIQPNYYSDQSEIMEEIYRILATKPEMTAAQQSMWLAKRPVEELYDISSDPYETNNLAGNPNYLGVLEELRERNSEIMIRSHDSGLAPEAFMYQTSSATTPYQKLQDQEAYPIAEILAILDELYIHGANKNSVLSYLSHPHPLIRYWTMIWLQYQDSCNEKYLNELSRIAGSDLEFLSIVAAETICKFESNEQAVRTLIDALSSDNEYNLLMAARAIELLGAKTKPFETEIRHAWEKLKNQTEGKWKGYDLYASWALTKLFDKEEAIQH